MTSLAGSALKMKEDHQKIKIVAALFVIMPANYLNSMVIYDLIQINLKSIPMGWQPFMKKIILCN